MPRRDRKAALPGAPAVEAEDEFIEVGLEVLAAQPVIDAQGPDLEVGEDPVNPGQHDVGSHLADDMGIVGDRPKPRKPPKDYDYVEELINLQIELKALCRCFR